MGHGEEAAGPPAAEAMIEELERELGEILTTISTKLESGEETELQYKQWLGSLAGLVQKSIDEFRISAHSSAERHRDRQSDLVGDLAELADLRSQQISNEAEIAALQEQLGISGTRDRNNSEATRTIERFENDIEAVEGELQAAKDQIAELRTANMRLENENESLLDLEDRAANLTEENGRMQEELTKLHNLRQLEDEHATTVLQLEETMNENQIINDEMTTMGTQLDETTAQYERCRKHLDEANEIVSIKQNMIDALREQIEQASASTSNLGLDLESEMHAGDRAPSSHEMDCMREKVRDLEAKNRAAQATVNQLNEKLRTASERSVSPRSSPKVDGVPEGWDAPACGLQREEDEELSVELAMLEEEFLTNVERLCKGFTEIEKCISNVERAVERGGLQGKVAMEVRVATLAKETMAIQLRELFGSNRGPIPEFVASLKQHLAETRRKQLAAAAAPKPVLTMERLEAFKQRHNQVILSAQTSVRCLSNIVYR